MTPTNSEALHGGTLQPGQVFLETGAWTRSIRTLQDIANPDGPNLAPGRTNSAIANCCWKFETSRSDEGKFKSFLEKTDSPDQFLKDPALQINGTDRVQIFPWKTSDEGRGPQLRSGSSYPNSEGDISNFGIRKEVQICSWKHELFYSLYYSVWWKTSRANESWNGQVQIFPWKNRGRFLNRTHLLHLLDLEMT